MIVAVHAHQGKSYHLGLDCSVTRSNLVKANRNRDYKIFEEFTNYLIEIAKKKRINNVVKLNGSVYAFDSRTIDLCLEVFWWAKVRKHKGGIKIHTLYDIENQIPTFVHIITASVNDMVAMDVISYEPKVYYIFDRGYNDFKRLFTVHAIGVFFVVRAKSNLQFKLVKWIRRLPKNILSDCIGVLIIYNSGKKYLELIRKVTYFDQE